MPRIKMTDEIARAAAADEANASMRAGGLPSVVSVPSQGIVLVDDYGGASDNSSAIAAAAVSSFVFSAVLAVGAIGLVAIGALLLGRTFDRRL